MHGLAQGWVGLEFQQTIFEPNSNLNKKPCPALSQILPQSSQIECFRRRRQLQMFKWGDSEATRKVWMLLIQNQNSAMVGKQMKPSINMIISLFKYSVDCCYLSSSTIHSICWTHSITVQCFLIFSFEICILQRFFLSSLKLSSNWFFTVLINLIFFRKGTSDSVSCQQSFHTFIHKSQQKHQYRRSRE